VNVRGLLHLEVMNVSKDRRGKRSALATPFLGLLVGVVILLRLAVLHVEACVRFDFVAFDAALLAMMM